MGRFYILFIATLILSCSSKIENDKVPQKTPQSMEKKPANSINTKSNLVIDEHISGNGTQNISSSSSSRISGKK